MAHQLISSITKETHCIFFTVCGIQTPEQAPFRARRGRALAGRSPYTGRDRAFAIGALPDVDGMDFDLGL
jgi:hypothetical protein